MFGLITSLQFPIKQMLIFAIMERKIFETNTKPFMEANEVSALIKRRRTIYPEVYIEKDIPKEIVRDILTNATWAPTHGKTQPWRFKVYMGKSREILHKKLHDLYVAHTPTEDFSKHKLARIGKRLEITPVLVLLFMKRTENTRIPYVEEMAATAAAGQNMLLTAASYGVGSFWSSPKFLYTPEANEMFGLKPDDAIKGLFYFGYTDKEPPVTQRKPLEEVVEWFE